MTYLETLAKAAARFNGDISEHAMMIALEEGVYRHLQFRRPGTSMYWFDVITSPGLLTIQGDMGCYVFSRTNDMFEFFRGRGINPQYWGEKLQAISRNGGFEEHSSGRYREFVKDDFDERKDQYAEGEQAAIWEQIRVKLLNEDGDMWETDPEDPNSIYEHLRDFEVVTDSGTYGYSDAWEHSFKDYSFQFLWCCNAIVWAIAQYQLHRPATTESKES